MRRQIRRKRELGEPDPQIYFPAFIAVPQQIMSHTSAQPHASSTDTTSPQTSQEYRSPWFTFFVFLLPPLAGAFFVAEAAFFPAASAVLPDGFAAFAAAGLTAADFPALS